MGETKVDIDVDSEEVEKRKTGMEEAYKGKIPDAFSKEWAKQVRDLAKKLAPELTGTLKQSIKITKSSKGWDCIVGKPETGKPNKAYSRPYASAVEYGSKGTDKPIFIWQTGEWEMEGRKGISENPFFRPALKKVNSKLKLPKKKIIDMLGGYVK